jgi:polyribonucleotide nucleotidyltransferase
MKPESHQYSATVGDQTITFETGKLAAQAGGSMTVRQGDSIVFAAATMPVERSPDHSSAVKADPAKMQF